MGRTHQSEEIGDALGVLDICERSAAPSAHPCVDRKRCERLAQRARVIVATAEELEMIRPRRIRHGSACEKCAAQPSAPAAAASGHHRSREWHLWTHGEHCAVGEARRALAIGDGIDAGGFRSGERCASDRAPLGRDDDLRVSGAREARHAADECTWAAGSLETDARDLVLRIAGIPGGDGHVTPAAVEINLDRSLSDLFAF
ncbi:MAG TPA: hypothetical protein VIF62_17830 [Labilithrix sp.]